MKRIDDPKSVILRDTVVLLGKFDGFHLGHQRLLKEALRLKAEHAENCPDEAPWSVVVFTFDVYPGQVLNALKSEESSETGNHAAGGADCRTIQTREECHTDLISDEADYLVEFPFNRETMSMEPEQFVEWVLVEKLGVRKIVCGYDFRFGKKRRGDVRLLQEMGKQRGFDVLVVPKVKIRFGEPVGDHVTYELIYDHEDRSDAGKGTPEAQEGKTDGRDERSDDLKTMTTDREQDHDRQQDQNREQEISSSLIKEEISKGHMERVSVMLGRNFYITGNVLKGKQLGRTIGFPTANQEAPDHKILPPDGVYATRVTIVDAADCGTRTDTGSSDADFDGKKASWLGITNLGRRPTFDDGENRTVETCLLDFQGDLYGRKISVEFLHFIRPEQRFESVQKLQEQMKQDMATARVYFQTNEIGDSAMFPASDVKNE